MKSCFIIIIFLLPFVCRAQQKSSSVSQTISIVLMKVAVVEKISLSLPDAAPPVMVRSREKWIIRQQKTSEAEMIFSNQTAWPISDDATAANAAVARVYTLTPE